MSIADLAGNLESNQLHVVIFGPGYGESIAVHIPDAGWVICDSLRSAAGSSDFVPAAELLDARGERAVATILTHPHDDHVGGLDRLVHKFSDGPVGVIGIHMPEEEFTESDDAGEVVAKSARIRSLAAVAAYWRAHPEHRWEMNADDEPLILGPASLEVLHPNHNYLETGQPDPTARPNAYSTPVLITWETVRVILGADLPKRQWVDVLGPVRDPELADHHLVKVSHHASTGALHEDLLRSGDRDKLALVAPWERGGRILPKLTDTGGVAWLLERRGTIGLTSPGRALDSEIDAHVTLAALDAAVSRRALPAGAGTVELKHRYDPDESWIAASFNRDGRLTAVELGADACLVSERLLSEDGPYPRRT